MPIDHTHTAPATEQAKKAKELDNLVVAVKPFLKRVGGLQWNSVEVLRKLKDYIGGAKHK